MPLALSIQPFSDVVDMYGDADSSLSASLSGHVSVSLTSPSSLFVRRRETTRVLLQSLIVTFEGHSEAISPGTGYASIRLCSITRELLPEGAMELSNEGHEDSDEPCLWNVIFDMHVPGWLPTTSIYGDASLQSAGTSYALYATATFVDIDHGHSLFSFARMCGLFHPRMRTVDAHRHSITLRRFVEPQHGHSSNAFPMSVYIVDARRAPDSEYSSTRPIPCNILEKIQVVASMPYAIAMDEDSVPFVLRIRTKDLDDSERERLRITEFSVDAEQVEVYRKELSHDGTDRYPIPSQNYQPPRVPLRNPHPIHTLYDSGFLGTHGSCVKRSFSLLAPAESGRYVISGNGHAFTSDRGPSSEDSWYILEAKVHIFTEPCLRDWAGQRMRRITESSPLFGVQHFLHVVINCEYDLADSKETTLESLHFSIPMKYVNIPRATVPWGDVEEYAGVRKNQPCSQSLQVPAYAQLFHSNGEQKVDYSIPLPLYEPPSVSPSSVLLSNEQMAA